MSLGCKTHDSNLFIQQTTYYVCLVLGSNRGVTKNGTRLSDRTGLTGSVTDTAGTT